MKSSFYPVFILLFFFAVIMACNSEDDITSFTDSRDGNEYQLFHYGNQIWMAENLKFNAGDSSWAYNDDSDFVKIYGRLYDWDTAVEACPDGWRLPLHQDFNLLVNNLGGPEIAGEVLKSENHLSLTKGGFRDPEGDSDQIEHHGVYWTGSEIIDDTESHELAWMLAVFSYDNTVTQSRINKTYGFSIRCVMD
jgi:uncharacterized protein (TIGR02145 family)